MLHITFSKYDCIIVHKAYYLFTCTCVSINSFHSHSHSHSHIAEKYRPELGVKPRVSRLTYKRSTN